MRQPRSIRLHLSAACFFFFFLVIVLGLFSISRLSEFNKAAAGIADLWLPNTRAIGDLNNFTSDFRAAEGSDVLSSSESEMAATQKEMNDLDRTISQSLQRYERISHDASEADLYRQFKAKWSDYRDVVNHVLALSRANRKLEANGLYMTASRPA